MKTEELIHIFYHQADKEQARAMAAYMQNRFSFLGLAQPKRRALAKEWFKEAKKRKIIDWDFVDQCWSLPEREFQYLACDYLRALQSFLIEDDLPHLKQLVITKSWWDTVDSLARTIGSINYPSPIVDQEMLELSVADNIWLRRIAINHQLLRKEQMNTDLLSKIIVNNLNQTEFFINKAIGWILRDYSKTNPAWVKTFIKSHKENMAKLSIKEASKYLK